MADMTMCPGDGCDRRASCYRHTASASKHAQSWFTVVPVEPDGSCRYWWPTEATLEAQGQQRLFEDAP
jgi:hypothetical protein